MPRPGDDPPSAAGTAADLLYGLTRNEEDRPLIIRKRNKRRGLRSRPIRAGCPFCWEWLPPPAAQTGVFTEGECVGGRCPCGAYFVVDETGRSGGQALLDLQALACGGDLDRALALRDGVDCRILHRSLVGATRSFGGRSTDSQTFGPRVWALKLADDEERR
jgi:hypothetical protein